MPIPRKNTLGTTKKKTITKKKKKTTSLGRAKKGEKLLVTCAPIVTGYMLESLANSLHGSMFTDDFGQYWQIMAVRVDEKAHKIYGTCQEMHEAAPFMFLPVK